MSDARYVERFSQQLFERGLEGYDATQKDTGSKGATNIGGAKLFFHPNWRGNQSKIQFLNPQFFNVLKELPVVVYTLNKVQIGPNGEIVRVKDRTTGQNTNAFNRTHTGLMLYCTFDEAKNCGEMVRDRLIESFSKTFDLRPYVEVASKIPDPGGKIRILTTMQHRDTMGGNVPLKMHACVIFSIPSGPTAGFWQFQNQSAASRDAMSKATTATQEETGEVPF